MIRALIAGAVFALAANRAAAGAPEKAQALVERAAGHILEVGRERAFADFNRPDGGFVEAEFYVFCIDAAGIELANGGNPRLVGKDLSAVRDATGRVLIAELNHIGETKGQGWYEYLWPNPVKARVERKVVYVVRVDDQTICGSGYYNPDRSRPDRP